MENSKNMAAIAYQAIDEKKGSDIKILDISKVSVLADYFLIATGDNSAQIQAIMDEIEEKMHRGGYNIKRLEGNKNSTWILMDYSDIVIHIFNKEDRLFYDLERIWSDGKEIEPASILA